MVPKEDGTLQECQHPKLSHQVRLHNEKPKVVLLACRDAVTLEHHEAVGAEAKLSLKAVLFGKIHFAAFAALRFTQTV